MIQNKRKQRKKRFDEIEYRLRESCQKGDFESIKFNLSEKVQNESKELTFKIDKTNKTALLFQVNKQIDHLIIPTNSKLQVIGEYAFLNCDNLIKVEIPTNSKLQIIKRNAFSYSIIEEIYFQKSLIELKK